MLTLSGAPDRAVSWSEFSLLLKRLKQDMSHSFFMLLQDFHFNYIMVLYGCWFSVVEL